RRALGVALEQVGREVGLGLDTPVVGAEQIRLPLGDREVDVDAGDDLQADVVLEQPGHRVALEAQLLGPPAVWGGPREIDADRVRRVREERHRDRRAGRDPAGVDTRVLEAEQQPLVKGRDLGLLGRTLSRRDGGGQRGEQRSQDQRARWHAASVPVASSRKDPHRGSPRAVEVYVPKRASEASGANESGRGGQTSRKDPPGGVPRAVEVYVPKRASEASGGNESGR